MKWPCPVAMLPAGLPAGLLAVLLAAAAPAQVAPPAGKPSPWNASTAPPEARPPQGDDTLSVRIYQDTDRTGLLPYRPHAPRRNEQALAVDVSAVMTRCADGSQLITALVIGGRLTPLDNRCPDHVPDDRATPVCDPQRWTCSTPSSP